MIVLSFRQSYTLYRRVISGIDSDAGVKVLFVLPKAAWSILVSARLFLRELKIVSPSRFYKQMNLAGRSSLRVLQLSSGLGNAGVLGKRL